MRKFYYLVKVDQETLRDFIIRAGETLKHYNAEETKEVFLTTKDGVFTGLKVYYEEKEPVYTPVYCQYCGSITMPLGMLGDLMHFRCVSCGLEYSRQL